MRTTLSTKGQVILPATLREQDGIVPGDEFEVVRVERGEYRLTRVERRGAGIVAWLRACPEKGYFVAIDSESTDDL